MGASFEQEGKFLSSAFNTNHRIPNISYWDKISISVNITVYKDDMHDSTVVCKPKSNNNWRHYFSVFYNIYLAKKKLGGQMHDFNSAMLPSL
jgi:hypothetical protein